MLILQENILHHPIDMQRLLGIFENFPLCEDKDFFTNEVVLLDILINKPPQDRSSSSDVQKQFKFVFVLILVMVPDMTPRDSLSSSSSDALQPADPIASP